MEAKDHRRAREKEFIPEKYLVYCFMKPKGSAAIRCSAVPVKGSSNELSAKRTNPLIVESGLDGLDQEMLSRQDLLRSVRHGIVDFPWCSLKKVCKLWKGQIRVLSGSLAHSSRKCKCRAITTYQHGWLSLASSLLGR